MQDWIRTGWFGDYWFGVETVHAVRPEQVIKTSYGTQHGTTVCGRPYAHVDPAEFGSTTHDKCRSCERILTKEAA